MSAGKSWNICSHLLCRSFWPHELRPLGRQLPVVQRNFLLKDTSDQKQAK